MDFKKKKPEKKHAPAFDVNERQGVVSTRTGGPATKSSGRGPKSVERKGGKKIINWQKDPLTQALLDKKNIPDDSPSGEMKLNKYLAHCGVAARRKAAELIKEGRVIVNGKMEDNPAYVVQSRDKISFDGKPIQPEERRVYLLMNKQKDTITTADDEMGRKTVLDIVGKSVRERIFPVGRLDRDTTGLLILTNDGDLAQKLSHPSYRVSKVYEAELNEPLMDTDLDAIRRGVDLEDGKAEVDWIRCVEGSGKRAVQLEIHVGKNRIVRRIFEHLGYEVLRLDRTYYAGLTKKDLPRGRFRHLTQREIIMVKHFTGK